MRSGKYMRGIRKMNHKLWYVTWLTFSALSIYQFMTWGAVGLAYFLTIAPLLAYGHLAVYRKDKKIPDRLVIAWHGTALGEITEKIMHEGFRPYTFFAKDMADAIAFGGEYVFGVAFIESENNPFWGNPERWQFICKDWVDADDIVYLYHIKSKLVYENDELRQKVFESNMEQ